MKKICQSLFLPALFCALLTVSCSKESRLDQQKVALTEARADDPPSGSGEYILEFSFDCKYIGNRHPDSNYQALTGSLECYNKKPSWWPNFNEKVYYPTWVWQHAGGYDPNDRKKLLLQLPPEEMYTMPRTNKDDIYDILAAKVQQNFPIRQRLDTITMADFGLTPAEELFLDNYFAEKILVMDGLRSSFPNNTVLSIDDEAILQVYMMFKTWTLNPRHNFFGELNTDHLSQYLYTDYSAYGFYIDWNNPLGWAYKTSQVNSVVGLPLAVGQKLYVILPKYYLYLMVDPGSIPTEFLFAE